MSEELEQLIADVTAAESRLDAYLQGKADAVVISDGSTLLLRRAQGHLVESEALHRGLAHMHTAVLDALPAHIAVLNEAGEILCVNRGWRTFADEQCLVHQNYLVGDNYFAACSPELSEKIGAVIRGEQQRYSEEYRCDSPEQNRWFRLLVTSWRDRDLRGAVVIHSDITEQVLARATQETVAEQASLLDKAGDAIMVCDLQGRPVYFNRSADRLYGLALNPCFDSPEFPAALEHLLENEDWAGELQRVNAEGAPITVESRWTLVRDESGAPRSILIIDTDVTERKKLEQQFFRAQRLESIGTLAGGIAHDLNNILAPITLSTDLLKAEETDPEKLELLDTIEESAHRGALMVRQVLSFARGVEGARDNVDVRELVLGIEKIVNDTFLKNVRVRTKLAPHLPTLCGDATQLHQVLLNLCVNARDAMPGGGQLSLAAHRVDFDEQYAALHPEARPGQFVCIEVSDSGTGMSPEVLNKIFEPFFTTKEVGKGTGLGLSTSLAIVKSHEGFIEVDSRPGQGTTFKVYLPCASSLSATDTHGTEMDLPLGKGEMVLIVDDEPAVRSSTQKTLETYGYRTLLAADGVEAVATYASRKEDIALVLTDMMMPILDGRATVQALLKINKDVRIIASSGVDDRRAPEEVKAFLPKPYTLKALLSAVREAIDAA